MDRLLICSKQFFTEEELNIVKKNINECKIEYLPDKLKNDMFFSPMSFYTVQYLCDNFMTLLKIKKYNYVLFTGDNILFLFRIAQVLFENKFPIIVLLFNNNECFKLNNFLLSINLTYIKDNKELFLG